MDFGFGLYTYHLVSDVARMGSRYAMVRGSTCTYSGCPATNSSVQTYVRSVSPGVIQSSMTVNTTFSGTPATGCLSAQSPGCLVSVQVIYPYSFLGIANLNISSTAQNVISQ